MVSMVGPEAEYWDENSKMYKVSERKIKIKIKIKPPVYTFDPL